PEQVKIKGTLAGCVVTPPSGGDPVTVVSGSVSGLLSGGTNDCLSLLGSSSASGTITVKWKTVEKLVVATTTVHIASSNVSGGIANPFSEGATYGSFNINGATTEGAFGGPSG